MSELTDEIVNKGLAEFMYPKNYGIAIIEQDHSIKVSFKENGKLTEIINVRLYTESLDALVPVWNKMREEMKTEMLGTFKLFDYNGKPWNFSFETDYNPLTDICVEYESDNPQQAAAYATYKTAKEMGLI